MGSEPTCGNCDSDEIEYFDIDTKNGLIKHAVCCECGEEWIE
jgi:hypothetical protein